jgi:hypothetical protein
MLYGSEGLAWLLDGSAAGAELLARWATQATVTSRPQPTSRAVQHVRRAEGVAARAHGMKHPPNGSLRDDGGLVCPCVDGHPVLPSGKPGRPDAALSRAQSPW